MRILHYETWAVKVYVPIVTTIWGENGEWRAGIAGRERISGLGCGPGPAVKSA